jgi:hypothetical protein
VLILLENLSLKFTNFQSFFVKKTARSSPTNPSWDCNTYDNKVLRSLAGGGGGEPSPYNSPAPLQLYDLLLTQGGCMIVTCLAYGRGGGGGVVYPHIFPYPAQTGLYDLQLPVAKFFIPDWHTGGIDSYAQSYTVLVNFVFPFDKCVSFFIQWMLLYNRFWITFGNLVIQYVSKEYFFFFKTTELTKINDSINCEQRPRYRLMWRVPTEIISVSI